MYHSHKIPLPLFIFLISQVNGSTLYYYHSVEEDAQLQWTLSPPVQSQASFVYVKNPAGLNMLMARGTAYAGLGAYSNRVVYNGDTMKSNMNFTLKTVAKSDAGAYVTNYGNKNHKGATLVIYVKPGPASITPSVPVVGTDLLLKCTSQSNSVPADHDLVMTYSWFVNGSNPPDDDRFVTENQQLTFKNIRRSDKGSKITCKAKETPTLPSDSSPEYTVDPEYGPASVTFTPATTTYKPLVGTQLGPIDCKSDCKPDCTYTWRRDTTVVANSPTLTIASVQKGTTGNYSCMATNKHGSGMPTYMIDVTVHFAPENIALNPTNIAYKILSGTKLGPIICSAECEPTCTYEWSRDGNSDFTDYNILSIPSIQRGETGTYTCTATNKYGTKTLSVGVVVEFEPMNIILSPDARHYQPVQGSRLGPVNCSADCEPACTYQWSRDGNNISPVSSVLDITSIQRGQTGSYRCTAINKHGTKTISVTVTVKFSPKILHFDSKPGRPEVDENQTIHFVCETEGYPVPTVTIYFERNATVFIQDINLSTTLILKNVNCLLTGHYFCNAINEIGNATMNSSVNVLCPPRPDYRKKIEVIHGIEKNENLNITGNFIANPPPIFIWRFRRNDSQTETTLTNGTESFYFINQQKDYISYSSRAILNITQEKHVGQYILQASNTKGSATLVQTVFIIRHPSQPVGIAAVCTSVNTAEIIWISKFNGGKEQHFLVGVKTTDEEKYTIRKNLTDPGENVAMREVIDRLQDETHYFFTVYAENKYGRSMLSKDLECVTPVKVIEQNSRAAPNIASVVLFVLSALFHTSVVTGLSIRYFIKRKRNSPNKRPKKDVNKEQTAMDSMNAYHELGERAQPVDTPYQELQESRTEMDTINAYQELGERKQPVEAPYQELQEFRTSNASSLKTNSYQDLGKRDIGAESQYQKLKTTKTKNEQDSEKGNMYDELGQQNPLNVYDEIKSHAKY